MRWMIVALTLALAACGKPSGQTKASAEIPAVDLIIEHHDKDLDFTWTAAPQTITQPKLLVELRADANHELAQARAAAGSDRAARPSDAPFFKHIYNQEWSRAADTPQLLVLGSTLDTFTGGAHGMYSFASAIWDKTDGRLIRASQLFEDWPRARDALTAVYCKALDAERKRRRPQPLASGSFTDCPAIERQTLLPTGDTDGRITALKVQIGPYEAGPYSEGNYELTLDLPPAVVALVKPAYRDAFGYKRS